MGECRCCRCDSVAPLLPNPNLDSDDASSFENEVTSFQVLISGAAELDVHLLNGMRQADDYDKIRKTVTSIYLIKKILIRINNLFHSFVRTFPLLSIADAVWTVSPCRP